MRGKIIKRSSICNNIPLGICTSTQSDHGLQCLLKESLDTKYKIGEQRPDDSLPMCRTMWICLFCSCSKALLVAKFDTCWICPNVWRILWKVKRLPAKQHQVLIFLFLIDLNKFWLFLNTSFHNQILLVSSACNTRVSFSLSWFYDPVNPLRSCQTRLLNLLTLFLGRLSKNIKSEMRTYSTVNSLGTCPVQSVNLFTLSLGRLSPPSS